MCCYIYKDGHSFLFICFVYFYSPGISQEVLRQCLGEDEDFVFICSIILIAFMTIHHFIFLESIEYDFIKVKVIQTGN